MRQLPQYCNEQKLLSLNKSLSLKKKFSFFFFLPIEARRRGIATGRKVDLRKARKY
jgi:hypothetical protein